MRIYVLFGQRKEQYDGQHAPEALDVIDEYSVDSNAGFMDESLANAMRKFGEEFEGIAWFPVEIAGDVEVTLRRILSQQYEALSATLVDPTPPPRDTRNASIKVTTDVTPGQIEDDEIRG